MHQKGIVVGIILSMKMRVPMQCRLPGRIYGIGGAYDWRRKVMDRN
jgi:hypothetical protein